jgi:hypothetical protein
MILEFGTGNIWKRTLERNFVYDAHILSVILHREGTKKKLIKLRYKILNSNSSQKKKKKSMTAHVEQRSPYDRH